VPTTTSTTGGRSAWPASSICHKNLRARTSATATRGRCTRTDPHFRDDGTIYHLWGDKRLYYCPECCVEFCEDAGIEVPDADELSKMSLLVVSQQMPPSDSHPTDTPLWEECTDDDHRANLDL